MQKLTYEEYRGCKDILMIDLHNGYTIIAIKIWNKEKENYTVELRIKENTVNKWDLIDNRNNSKPEEFVFDTNYRYINSAILKKISQLFEEGFFDHYIDRYNYEIKCLNRGNSLYEEERLGDK